MKKIIVLAAFYTLSTPCFAFSVGIQANSMKEFYQLRTFKDVSEDITPEAHDSPVIKKIIAKVSADLTKRFNEKYAQGESEIVNYEFCSKKCSEYGDPQKHKPRLETGLAFIDSEETKQCQRACKAYELESNAYISGIRHSDRQKSASSDCSGATVSTGRSTGKEQMFDSISRQLSGAGSIQK